MPPWISARGIKWRRCSCTADPFMIGINGGRDNTRKKSYLRNFVMRRFYFVSTPIELFLAITLRITARPFCSRGTTPFDGYYVTAARP